MKKNNFIIERVPLDDFTKDMLLRKILDFAREQEIKKANQLDSPNNY